MAVAESGITALASCARAKPVRDKVTVLMPYRLVTISFWLAGIVALSAAQPSKPFVHPGMLQNRIGLDFMKRKVAASEQPWKQAWDNLLQQPYSSLDFVPKPVTHIVRGAFGRGSVGDRQLSDSANAAYSQALQWYITGDKKHSDKAIAILNAWSSTLWDFEGNDAKLLAAWTGGPLCNAAEILRTGDSGWSPHDVSQFKRMLTTVYVPLLKDYFPEANGNWDAAIIDTLLSIGIFNDDRVLFDAAVQHYLTGPGNGGIAKYIYPSGQCEENTRDQGHTQLGLGYFALAAQTAWTQGVDLYSAANNRLALGFEFTARYLLGDEVQIYGLISPQGRGRFSDIYEGIYQHFRFTNNLKMTYSARAIEKTRGTGWTALTMYRGPRQPATAAAPSEVTPDSPITIAGALDAPTAPAPPNAVILAPGQSIQSTLDERAASGGGWVVLAKGLHTISAALRLPSGVTLAGGGRESILILDPKQTGPAIVSASPDLHDVTLRDFVIEGAASPKTSADPNQDRRVRSYQNAPSRAGIILSGDRLGQMSGIRLEHLTVRHCTHYGAAIRGAARVSVIASDISDNGASVVPGPGLEHNLSLTHVTGAEIEGNRLDDSSWGAGLYIAESSDLVISSNEVARNHLSGIQVGGSQRISVKGNLAEGNDGPGILLDFIGDANTNVEAGRNAARNNGGQALR
jgi:parallel beta-helix repeat protein